LHLDAGKNSVGNLNRVSNFVLAVEEVPHVKETVHAGQVEKTSALGRPATVSKVALMVASLHNRLAEFLGPDLSGPVTNRKEVLKLGGVTLEGVDGAVMLTVFNTVTHVNFDLILTFVGLHDITLLATDQVLQGRGLGVILKGGSTANLGKGLALYGVGVVKNELISGTFSEHALIPPEKATISRGGDALGSGLGSGQPVDIVDGVVVGLFKESGLDRLDNSGGATLTLIKELKGAVVGTTNNNISIFVVEHKGAKRRGGFKSTFGPVGVVQVPDVGHLRHVGGSLLETELGV
jgi:hypothetical protein